MSKEIVNRVQKSGLVTIDMDDIELPKKISKSPFGFSRNLGISFFVHLNMNMVL